jgi:hypothetical protein
MKATIFSIGDGHLKRFSRAFKIVGEILGAVWDNENDIWISFLNFWFTKVKCINQVGQDLNKKFSWFTSCGYGLASNLKKYSR